MLSAVNDLQGPQLFASHVTSFISVLHLSVHILPVKDKMNDRVYQELFT